MSAEIVYRVDSKDRLTAVNAEWDLFDGAPLPPITHGICPACEARMYERLGMKNRPGNQEGDRRRSSSAA